MPLPLLRAAMEAWPDTDFIQVYGLTEVAGVATHLMPEAHRDAAHPERLVSAGRPIPGVRGPDRRPGHARGPARSASTARSGCAPRS